MCNLYRQRSTEDLGRLFDAVPLDLPFEAKPDIYPKYEALVVRKKAVTNVRNLASPFWQSTIANPAQRCLVPFTSFAEPRPGKDPETGRPSNWWFTVEGEECCAFAGIWRMSEGAKRFAFLTCEPNPLVAPLHPKAMPVILQREDYDAWLDGEAADACSLAQPFPSQLMRVA
jgi:putative SOS response-associated peptidase YedK